MVNIFSAMVSFLSYSIALFLKWYIWIKKPAFDISVPKLEKCIFELKIYLKLLIPNNKKRVKVLQLLY